MLSPYTLHPFEAILAAQVGVATVITAMLVARRRLPHATTVLLVLATWIAALRPAETLIARGLGRTLSASHGAEALWSVELLAVVASVLTRQRALVAVAAVGGAFLAFLTGYLRESYRELEVLHVAWIAALAALGDRDPSRPTSEVEPTTPETRVDLAVATLATALAAVVAVAVLGRYTNSGDEWAPTYQASLFAKLRAYGSVPPCGLAFRAYWVFPYDGRTFEQYPPGWAFFMTPFFVLGVPWLAGPFAFGAFVAGTGRLGRRAAAGAMSTPSDVRMAGLVAAAAAALGWSALVNGASRYSHIFVAALYVWALEAVATLAEDAPRGRAQTLWGLMLGSSAALLLATRPADGAMLGVGLTGYFAFVLARRRPNGATLAAIVLAFAAWMGLTLVVLRLQLGRWFETGYAIAQNFAPDATPKFSAPRPGEWRYGLPLGPGAYCWWPASPALGLAGLLSLRGDRARRLGVAFVASFLPLLALYAAVEFGRDGFDRGYGPRFLLPLVAPMAVGTGVTFARLRAGAGRSSRARLAFHAAVASSAIALAQIAPLLYPYTSKDVRAHNQVHDAIARSDVHHAVVFGTRAVTSASPLDLPENLPLDLYPDQDVLIAFDRSPEVVACVRDAMPERAVYRAVPGEQVTLVPY